MKRSIRIGVTVVMAALAVTTAAGPLAGSAGAASGSLPTDPAARGYVGLCNENGDNVTAGSVSTSPFIWKAVASVPPPAGYQGKGQSAVLGVVQPRPGTAPADWNGTPLTAASFYHQKGAPAVQSTYADRSLASVIRQFPPQVDGLYVLRVYFGRTGYGNYSAMYPTTTIQVTGSSWHVIQGGTVDCRASTATSNEQLTGVAGKTQTTARKPSSSQRTLDTVRARTISVPAATGVAGTSAGAQPGTVHRSSIPDAAAAADTSSSSSAGLTWALIGIIVALIFALVTIRSGAFAKVRRTGSPRS